MDCTQVAPYDNPLDVLRRHVPTPFEAMGQIGGSRIVIESNDLQLLTAVPDDWRFKAGRGTGPRESDFHWRIVRDCEVRETLEPATTLTCEKLCFVSMGASLVAAVDGERKELLGFVGANADRQTLSEVIYPMLLGMMLEHLGSTTDPGGALAEESCGNEPEQST